MRDNMDFILTKLGFLANALITSNWMILLYSELRYKFLKKVNTRGSSIFPNASKIPTFIFNSLSVKSNSLMIFINLGISLDSKST